ncbi:MAG: hypothetical protein M5R41_01130 [Bacteroidia bacterium]|nr:hypothetical protein [Bacteroidia bacterium]
MKRFMIAIVAVFAIAAVQNTLLAREINPPLSTERQEYIEKNILAGLNHKSLEVRCDYIQLIIDLKRAYPKYDFDYAIIPLMDKLKNEDQECIRIIAALALYEFQDSRMGKFAVVQTARHDSSSRLVRHCQTLVRRWDNRSEQQQYVAEVRYPF